MSFKMTHLEMYVYVFVCLSMCGMFPETIRCPTVDIKTANVWIGPALQLSQMGVKDPMKQGFEDGMVAYGHSEQIF